MAEGPIGDFFRRIPDGNRLHTNAGRLPTDLLKIPVHNHKESHVRFLWASDAPGPDGRVGWWEKSWSPIYADDLVTVTGWKSELDEPVRGNGPDSARNMPANWRHEFTMLSMTGYHQCLFFNIDPVTGKPSQAYTGHEPGR